MYNEKRLVGIAKRENNIKRKYLVVNRLQGKHVPVSPKEAFQMFSALAAQVQAAYAGERLLLVGFAETATAIGAALATELDTFYIQTTREDVLGAEYLYFSESHSHATEQKLVRNELDRIIHKIDRIVFVEDEVTTGNTILKIVNLLAAEYPGKAAFAVASLLNGMQEEALAVYRQREIPVHYLVKTDHSGYTQAAENYRGDGKYFAKDERQAAVTELRINGKMDARRCVQAREYRKACGELWTTIEKTDFFVDKRRVLVLGTEEFMYPALYAAGKMEERGIFVRCHSTTRSPIAVSSEEEYPLHRRYELESLYEIGRRTFIYELDKYDAVLILTDARDGGRGADTLVNALKSCGNQEIFLLRWCEKE
ncbi:phosphoribosyltransferase domain-containing protein [Lachnospiraceae bacterium 46-15]